MERWRQATIRSILSNEKYCGDVLYQKTYSKDYLTHKSVKNRDVLPQYYWENNHTAIIDRNFKASRRLCAGVGFRFEGAVRQILPGNRDAVIYGLLKDDFLGGRFAKHLPKTQPIARAA